MSSSISVIVTMKAKPGREAEMRAQARSMIEPSRAEPGCLSYNNYVDPEDPYSWVVIEEWASRAAFETHMASPHLADSLAKVGDLLAEPPSVRILSTAN
ncbi:putative quinol monooxygenase [Kitasatospora sp. NPDC059408]|uniref:putative quinol monooxygenase n=1 Tax=Kitasatospora sp. NPDC059408 TaxID=3346823 RepID=UPI00367B2D81